MRWRTVTKRRLIRSKLNMCILSFCLGLFFSFPFHLSISKTGYHQCVNGAIPYVSTLLETAQYLLYNSNSSFARFGDGEVQLIKGGEMWFQKRNRTLAALLYQTFTSNIPQLMIGIPDIFSGYAPIHQNVTEWWATHDTYRQWFLAHANMTRQYLNTRITAAYVNAPLTCTLLNQTYQTLRMIWNQKDIVLVRGNNSQIYRYDIYDNARSVYTMFVPKHEVWDHYEMIKHELFSISPSKLIILACGPVAKVLAYQLALGGRRALDLGHLAKDYDTFYGNRSTKLFYDD